MAKSRARFLSELLLTTGLVKKSKSALAGADEVIDLSVLPSIPNSKLTNSSITINSSATILGGSVTLTTANVAENTNLYYTDARADARITAADTGDLSEGSNLYYTNARADARVNLQTGSNLNLSSKDTGDLSEGSNLYYTNARADARIAAADTDDLSEGSSNLYYTDARADARIAAADTGDLSEGSNLYYTDARADARVALVVDSAPSTLNTLNELAAALGDDANFSTTVTNSIAAKLPLAGGTLTGTLNGVAANFTSDVRVSGWLTGASATNTLFSGNNTGTIIQTPSNTNNAAGSFYIRDSLGVVHFTLNTNTNVSTFAGTILTDGTTSNSVPKYSFSGDTDTGLGYVGTNAVALIAGASRKFYVNATNAYFQNLTGGVSVPLLSIGSTTVIDSSRNVSANTSVVSGNSSTSGILRSHYSDGSYMTLEGYGLVMNRGASYIRPSTDNDKYLYIGGADASLDWLQIHFRAGSGLYMTGARFMDSGRNLENINTISSGHHTISTTGTGNGLFVNGGGNGGQIKVGDYTRITGATTSNAGAFSFNANHQGAQLSTWVPDYAGSASAGMFVLRQDGGGIGSVSVYVKNSGTTSTAQNLSTFTKVAQFHQDGYFSTPAGLRVGSTEVISSGRAITATSATFTGDVGMITGHSSGKFAVMATSVHGSYDFYNNGTSYFNGSVTVDDVLNVTGTNKAIQMNGVTRINGVGDIIGTSYYVGATAVIDTSRNLLNIGTIATTQVNSTGWVRSTANGLSLWASGSDSYTQVGPNGGGASGVFGAHRESASSLDYTTYIGYDCYYDDGNNKWYANRTTLGRKWKTNFGGYHQNRFSISTYDGGGTTGSSIAAGWLEVDWAERFGVDASGNGTFAGTISSGAITSAGLTSSNSITMSAGNLSLNSTSDGNQAFRYYRADGTLVGQIYPYNNRYNVQTYNNQGIRLKSHGSGQIELEGNVVINEDSADVDFRVESNSNTHMLFVDGGKNGIGIGTSVVYDHQQGAAIDMSYDGSIWAGGTWWAGGLKTGTTVYVQSSGDRYKHSSRQATMHHQNSQSGSHHFYSAPGGTAGDVIAWQELAEFDRDEVVFNNGGVDQDFRVESDTNTHALFVEGSSSYVKINTSGVPGSTQPGFLFTTDQLYTSAGTNTSYNYQVRFYNGNGLVGSITTNGSATNFNTSSDARLKQNIVDAPAASDDIDAMQVRSFDWKVDGEHQTYGMIAQELIEVAPDAVSGDEESEEMMAVDYSKLVPMLVKEIQQLRQRVAQLES